MPQKLNDKHISFDAKIAPSNNKLWKTHFVIPKAIVTSLLAKKQKRLVCTLAYKHTYPTALSPIGNDVWVIKVNQSILKKLKLAIGDTLAVQLEEDTSEFGLPFPPELEEVLAQDPKGKIVFDKLTKGKQRTLIYMINQKKADQRIMMSLKIINHLKENNGSINYKLLYS